MELRDQVIEVAKLRQRLALYRSDVQAAREAWDRDNQGILLALKEAQEKLDAEEKVLRDAAVIEFKETGDKAPVLGVGIREITILEYEAWIAFQWAQEHKVALALDKKAFESVAKATPLPFVKTRTEPQATIARDLDKVLKTAPKGEA